MERYSCTARDTRTARDVHHKIQTDQSIMSIFFLFFSNLAGLH